MKKKNFTLLALVFFTSILINANRLFADCTYSSLTLDQVTQNPDNSYDISMTFCASGGYDPCLNVTGAFGFMLEGGASILGFPTSLTSPQTGVAYSGFLYNNSTDSLIYWDNGQYLWWTCVSNPTDCGPLQPVCQSITITTDILPSKITCGGMEGQGILVAPYCCTGPDMEVYPNPNFPPPVPCSTFTLVADAGQDQDVLYRYNNSECTTLSVSSTGISTPPLSYLWSSGHTTTSIGVCPSSTTTYGVTITDAEGCTTSDDVTINVMDITCGNNKVLMCKPNGTTTRCIRVNKVASKLNSGWTLGPCSPNSQINSTSIESVAIDQYTTANDVRITFRDYEKEIVHINIYNLSGQLINSVKAEIFGEEDLKNIKIENLEAGIYVVSIFDQDGLVKSQKIIKQ